VGYVLNGFNRIYAVTGKSRLILAGFVVITASQLAVGIYLTLPQAPIEGEP